MTMSIGSFSPTSCVVVGLVLNGGIGYLLVFSWPSFPFDQW
jgi:hypothetical protein